MDKKEYEIIEGKFHDGLGTFAELVVIAAVRSKAQISPSSDEERDEKALRERSEAKMAAAIVSLEVANDNRAATLTEEREKIAACGQSALDCIQLLAETYKSRFVLSDIRKVSHTALDFKGGIASDLEIQIASGAVVPVSVKTDKSNKVALAGGQQSNLAVVTEDFYRTSGSELEALAVSKLGRPLSDLYESYFDISALFRHVMIKVLDIRNTDGSLPDINNFTEARPYNDDAVRHLLAAVRNGLHGKDECLLLVVDRKKGTVTSNTRLDTIPATNQIDSSWVRFTPGIPRGGRPVGTEVGVKLGDPQIGSPKTCFSHQIKHPRGGKQSLRFSDVTTRVWR